MLPGVRVMNREVFLEIAIAVFRKNVSVSPELLVRIRDDIDSCIKARNDVAGLMRRADEVHDQYRKTIADINSEIDRCSENCNHPYWTRCGSAERCVLCCKVLG